MNSIHDIIFCMGFPYGSWNTTVVYQEGRSTILEKWPGLELMLKEGGQKAKLQYLRAQCNCGLICDGVWGFSPAWWVCT